MTSTLRALVLAAATLSLAACGSEAPSDHTVDMGGVMHKPGLQNPTVNCTGCHGSNLRGGGEAPSCYSCHGQKW